MSEVRKQIEALLFSSGRAMSVEDLSNIMNLDKGTVKKGLKELKEFYDSANTSLMVTQESDSWKLNIKENYVSLVIKIVADTEMGKSVLETLAVIAWKSPVLQSEVIGIRTSKAYEHIKELVDAGFISKEKEGRSFRLRISEKFFEYFDVPGNRGIKEAFKEVKVPEKKKLQKLGSLDVVSVENNGVEHGKTAEIFGENEMSEAAKKVVTETVPKIDEKEDEIPPVDEEFLDKINKQIDEIASMNDNLEQDELFKKKGIEQETEEVETAGEELPEESASEELQEKKLEEDKEKDVSS